VRDLYQAWKRKLYLCDVRAMPSYGVGSWRMVSAQSVPQYGLRDRLDLVQATATVARRPL